jgi:adenylate kinase family enzyme
MLFHPNRLETITDQRNLLNRCREILELENAILITGVSGSGKSYIAEFLAATLDVPLVHLDAYGYSKKVNGSAEWLIDFRKVPMAKVYEGTADNLLQWAVSRIRTVIFPIPNYKAFIEVMKLKARDGAGQADPSFVRYWQSKSQMSEPEYMAYMVDRLWDRMTRHPLGHFIVYAFEMEGRVAKGWHEQ